MLGHVLGNSYKSNWAYEEFMTAINVLCPHSSCKVLPRLVSSVGGITIESYNLNSNLQLFLWDKDLFFFPSFLLHYLLPSN